jgi:hypothetical protein
MTGDSMAMQPSVQLEIALEKGLERLKVEHNALNQFLRPGFNEWAYGRIVITSDELHGIIKSSQLFDNAVDVLAQALVILQKILIPLRGLAIGVDPERPNRPMIVAAPPIVGL